ncbi:hypothetical protein JHK87_000818 [Glycine soja]|nr:hypothetical protein JHK87_000818 [Glycine soja]
MGSLQGTCHLSQMKMPTNLEHPIAYGFKICPLAGRRWQVKVAVWRWKRKVEVRRKKMKTPKPSPSSAPAPKETQPSALDLNEDQPQEEQDKSTIQKKLQLWYADVSGSQDDVLLAFNPTRVIGTLGLVAYALKSLGLEKGSVIAIDMPG